jgi:hypothetical protein
VNAITAIILQPATYHRLIDEGQWAARLRPFVAKTLLTRALPLIRTDPAQSVASEPTQWSLPTTARPARELSALSGETWNAIAAELIPADWLNAQLHLAVDGGFAWMQDDAPLPDTALDLNPLLERLGSGSGTLALVPVLNDTPTCDAIERVNGEGVFASCLPAGANVEGLARQTAHRLTRLLPARASLASFIAIQLIDADWMMTLTQTRLAAQWLWQVERFLGNLSIGLAALYLLLALWRNALQNWPSLWLVLAKPVGLIGATTTLAALSRFWLMSVSGSTLIAETLAQLYRAIATRLLIWGLTLLFLAALLWGARYLLLRRQRHTTATTRRLTRVRRQFT